MYTKILIFYLFFSQYRQGFTGCQNICVSSFFPFIFFLLKLPGKATKKTLIPPPLSLSLSLSLNGCSKAKEALSGLISLRTPVAVDEPALWVKVVSSLLADFGGFDVAHINVYVGYCSKTSHPVGNSHTNKFSLSWVVVVSFY